MNYLDLVNEVLKRLREDEVTSIFENQLSTLVSTMINDARRKVEQSHDWTTLRKDIVVPTVKGIEEYSIAGTQNRATIIDVRDPTSGCMLHKVPSKWIRKQYIGEVGETRPTRYALTGVDSSGDTQITFWGKPDGVYKIKVHVAQRETDLSAAGDKTSLPAEPIYLLATAMACIERGDVGTGDAKMWAEMADSSLSRYIMLDRAQNPDEDIWEAV